MTLSTPLSRPQPVRCSIDRTTPLSLALGPLSQNHSEQRVVGLPSPLAFCCLVSPGVRRPDQTGWPDVARSVKAQLVAGLATAGMLVPGRSQSSEAWRGPHRDPTEV